MSRITFCTTIISANVVALIVAAEQPIQQMLFFVSAAVFAVLAIDRVVYLSIHVINRLQRSCRESLLADSPGRNFFLLDDQEAVRLRTNVEAMRRHEMELVNCYSQRRCADEDVIRATSLRLMAEIQLLRYEKMPRSWAEKCAAYRPADQHRV